MEEAAPGATFCSFPPQNLSPGPLGIALPQPPPAFPGQLHRGLLNIRLNWLLQILQKLPPLFPASPARISLWLWYCQTLDQGSARLAGHNSAPVMGRLSPWGGQPSTVGHQHTSFFLPHNNTDMAISPLLSGSQKEAW